MSNCTKYIFAFFFLFSVALVIGCGAANNSGTVSTSTNNLHQNSLTSGAPVITSATSAGMTQGSNFSYQITAANNPSRFGATGLPSGLTLNSTTGTISGTVLTASQVVVTLTATNQYGQGSGHVTLVPQNSPNLIGTTHNCDAGVTAPTAAVSAQFSRLAFCDDFDSASTIDSRATGSPGFKWYVHRLYDIYQPAAYQVNNSTLTVGDTNYDYNWGLTTTDITTGAGASWTFGYFEARVDFNPTLGPNGPGWPSFWSFSTEEAETRTQDAFAELDFFEASPEGQSPGDYWGAFGATLHDWRYVSSSNYTNFMNGKNIFPSGVSWADWHVLGCLWVKGRVTWYLDGKQINTQGYSASGYGTPAATDYNGTVAVPPGVFNVLDTEPKGNMVILGSGPKWPMHVDWVRVWQP